MGVLLQYFAVIILPAPFMSPVLAPITRFAPSPTGMLHIGSARTALFNWLYAQHFEGQFFLRIEDTDRDRSTDEATAAILGGLNWLELNWDGDVIHQSQRLDRHIEITQQLLEQGKAYPCYCTPEELKEMRTKARAAGRPITYDGTWRDRDPADAPPGVKPTIRFRANHDGQTIIRDEIQGRIKVDNRQMDDLIILRSNGSPTYMLSVVVDDHDMGITHVIRGVDHLTNTIRQKQIYDALHWTTPTFAHIPLIHGPDNSKLSKRHGALAIETYRDMGYLPEAIRNYLLRLGWSHGDDEIIDTAQAIRWFDLDGIGKSPAKFDIDKLNHLNSHYLRKTPDEDLATYIKIALTEQNHDIDGAVWDHLVRLMPKLKERAKTLGDIVRDSEFLIRGRSLKLTESAEKLLDSKAKIMLADLQQELAVFDPWSVEALEARIRAFAAKRKLKFGKVVQPLRAVLTGGQQSPGIFEVLTALGKDESLRRIGDQASTKT